MENADKRQSDRRLEDTKGGMRTLGNSGIDCRPDGGGHIRIFTIPNARKHRRGG